MVTVGIGDVFRSLDQHRTTISFCESLLVTFKYSGYILRQLRRLFYWNTLVAISEFVIRDANKTYSRYEENKRQYPRSEWNSRAKTDGGGTAAGYFLHYFRALCLVLCSLSVVRSP